MKATVDKLYVTMGKPNDKLELAIPEESKEDVAERLVNEAAGSTAVGLLELGTGSII